MIPRVHKGGRTFAGLVRYLTRGGRHDGIETKNLSSPDARTCARIMQATSNDSTLLKQLAGRSARGRPLKKPVHHSSSSWHPDENPSDEEMFAHGRRCVKALGFENCQVLMVIHRDKTYRGKTRHELHTVVNRVSPENGMAAPDDDDAFKLSDVAKSYEQEQGKIYVTSRFEPRRSAERERKRMRLPDGSTTPMTAFERAQFSEKKRCHREERTPKAQREAELTRLGRGLRQLRHLRERADRPAPAIIEPASPDLAPRPERQRMDRESRARDRPGASPDGRPDRESRARDRAGVARPAAQSRASPDGRPDRESRARDRAGVARPAAAVPSVPGWTSGSRIPRP